MSELSLFVGNKGLPTFMPFTIVIMFSRVAQLLPNQLPRAFQRLSFESTLLHDSPFNASNRPVLALPKLPPTCISDLKFDLFRTKTRPF